MCLNNDAGWLIDYLQIAFPQEEKIQTLYNSPAYPCFQHNPFSKSTSAGKTSEKRDKLSKIHPYF
jgi:uncharacterized protein (DUF1330 family)